MDSSPLLSIPTELRLLILEYALRSSSTLAIGGCYTPSFSEPLAVTVNGGNITTSTSTAEAIRSTQPSVSFVNRQLRAESLPVFYQQNRFLLAVQNRRAKADVINWLNTISSNPKITSNLWNITIKHRFGILDYRGTVEFDLKNFRILGPDLWFNPIPPIYAEQVKKIFDQAYQIRASIPVEESGDLVVETLRRLIAVLGFVLE